MSDKDNFILTIKHHGKEVTINAGTWEVDYADVFDIIKNALLASGWSSEQVATILNENDER